MARTQKISPNLWFNSVADQAVNFYATIFDDFKIGRKAYYTEEGQEFHHKKPGTVMTIEFEIGGQQFVALNAGPEFKFNESISFIVNCDSQEEVDYYWEKLQEGGDPNAQQCGWLKDKFGVSWQIVPTEFIDMIHDEDSEKSRRVMQAMFTMKKLDLGKLRQAYRGK